MKLRNSLGKDESKPKV